MNVIELHSSLWNGLQARRQRLPHALLLAGQPGIGKQALGLAFAASLLCESPTADGQACGACLACNWQSQGNHPDFRLLQPEAMAEAEGEAEEGKKKASRQITIDQVRGLDEFLNVGTHRAGLRIVVVWPAEAMNRATANALLKTLEEPAPSTLFILISNEPMRLLPTIRSRCQVVNVALPSAAASRSLLAEAGVSEPERWLALAGGAPLQAMDLAQSGQGNWLDELVKRLVAGAKTDALAAAGALDKVVKDSKGKLTLRQLVEWCQKWAVDLALAQQHLPVRYFLPQQATIAQLVGGLPATRLVHFHRRLIECRRQVEQPLNARLFLEEFFLNYRELFA